MDLGVTEKLKPLLEAVKGMVDEKVLPVEEEFFAEVGKAPGGRFAHTDRQLEILADLKSEARARGL